MAYTEKSERVSVRWMVRRDLPEILEIEGLSWGSAAWTEEDFLSWLRRRECVGMVAERGERIIGYMVYERHGKYLQLHNLSVHPRYRRCGVGTQILSRLIDKLNTTRNRSALIVDVPDDNLPAHLFLRERGFRAEEVIRCTWPEPDVYRMAYRLGG